MITDRNHSPMKAPLIRARTWKEGKFLKSTSFNALQKLKGNVNRIERR